MSGRDSAPTVQTTLISIGGPVARLTMNRPHRSLRTPPPNHRWTNRT